jgi:tetratricopeptide (TPR) repeat protein
LKADRNNPQTLAALGRFHAAQGQYEKAEDYFRKAVALLPQITSLRFEFARVLVKTGKKKAAFAEMSSAAASDTAGAQCAFEYSRLAFEIGETSQAFKSARTAHRLDPASAAITGWMGYLYMHSQQMDSAKIFLENALGTDTNCVSCLRFLGDIYMGEREFTEAARTYGRAVAAGGSADTIGIFMGKALLSAGDNDGARQAFSMVFKGNGENAEARYWLAHGLIIDGKADKARIYVPKAKPSDARSGWLHLAEAELLEAEGKLPQAFLAYGTASRSLCKEAMPVAGLGRVSMKQKNYGAAIEYFGKAMGFDPLNVQFLVDMGKAYEATGEDASALAVYEEALKSWPKNPHIYCLIGNVLRKKRNYKHAVELINRGLNADPHYAPLFMLLGDVYRLSEKPVEAIAAYENAAKNGGREFLDAFRQAGLIYYYKLADKINAEKTLHRYVRAGGKDNEVNEILGRISSGN